ncbi:hypothetical protein K7432_011122 [Basidiobolus ranarum]|uniref:Uncharacterized protein n=1 Tax=Basidiobolus ranarum TaxID=34480 RepID=A0ABR2WMR4_9FUNG
MIQVTLLQRSYIQSAGPDSVNEAGFRIFGRNKTLIRIVGLLSQDEIIMFGNPLDAVIPDEVNRNNQDLADIATIHRESEFLDQHREFKDEHKLLESQVGKITPELSSIVNSLSKNNTGKLSSMSLSSNDNINSVKNANIVKKDAIDEHPTVNCDNNDLSKYMNPNHKTIVKTLQQVSAASAAPTSTPVSLPKKFLWISTVLVSLLLIYLTPLPPWLPKSFQLGAREISISYAILIFTNAFTITTFALNRRNIEKRRRNRGTRWKGMTTAVLAVGYREDPIVLEGCLRSIKALTYHLNRKVLLIIDGDEKQDEYMADIFMNVFESHNPLILRPCFVVADVGKDHLLTSKLKQRIADARGPVCILQPHRGKREAMYTGFAALLDSGIEGVVVTDSDTFLDPKSVQELAFCVSESPNIGAATGDVRIYNTGTWISFLSSLWYWFAFNLERSSQSYHGVVNCVSGPLGLYRMTVIRKIMDQWKQQSFMGVKCTYGDDRHLTNLVLSHGMKVKFTHHAICYTDTPMTFVSWFMQQTRWAKSFFREIPIQLACMHRHSPYMTLALIYHVVYPLLIVYNILECIYIGTIVHVIWQSGWLVMLGSIKAMFAVAVTGEIKFFFYPIYSGLYLIGHLPTKLFALFTLYNNSWGTNARLFRGFTRYQNYLPPIVWCLFLLNGAIQIFIRSLSDLKSQTNSDPVTVIVLLVLILVYALVYYFVFHTSGVMKSVYIRNYGYEEICRNTKMSENAIQAARREAS